MPSIYFFASKNMRRSCLFTLSFLVAIYMTLKGDYLQGMLFSESSQNGTQNLSKAFWGQKGPKGSCWGKQRKGGRREETKPFGKGKLLSPWGGRIVLLMCKVLSEPLLKCIARFPGWGKLIYFPSLFLKRRCQVLQHCFIYSAIWALVVIMDHVTKCSTVSISKISKMNEMIERGRDLFSIPRRGNENEENGDSPPLWERIHEYQI